MQINEIRIEFYKSTFRFLVYKYCLRKFNKMWIYIRAEANNFLIYIICKAFNI